MDIKRFFLFWGIIWGATFIYSSNPIESNPLNQVHNTNEKKVYYVRKYSNLKKVLMKPDTRFLISRHHNLRGKIIHVGANSILDFQGGSFSGGTLLLNNNVTITGKPVFFYSCSRDKSDTEFVGYTNDESCIFRAPIIIKNKSNILIENASFIMKTERDSKNWHGAIICYGETECQNIRIDNCMFDGGKVVFYANVNESEITNSQFINIPFTAIAIETVYDHTPWRHPKDIRINNNYIEQSLETTGETGNAMWCSGVEGLIIENNNFRLLQGIMLYCGDGNIMLKDIILSNNLITLLTGQEGFLRNMAAINIMGKSYQYLTKEMPEQSVTIKGNYIRCEIIGWNNLSELDNRGISLLYAANTIIKNNVIEGFTTGINASDHFRGNYYHVNSIYLYDNKLYNITKNGINVDCEPHMMEVINNEFKNDDSAVLNNRFIVKAGKGRIVERNNRVY